MSSFKQTLALAMRQPNPLLLRELRASARLGYKPWILLIVVTLAALFMAMIGGLSAQTNTPAEAGHVLFQLYFSGMLAVVTLVAPAHAAGAIAMEREGKTWEALLLSGLTPRQIARGKFLASVGDVATFIIALAPVGAMCFLFGGVSASEVLFAYLFLLVHAVLCICFGLTVSSLVQSTRSANLLTMIIAVVVGFVGYWFVGYGFSYFIHDLWPTIKAGTPVWYPLALGRADFGTAYYIILFGGPLIFYGVPSLMLYEHAAANVADPMDDRSSGIKRWFLVSCLALTAFGCSLPFALPISKSRTPVVYGVEVVLSMFLLYCALLLAGEPVQAPRRVRVTWDRERASAWRRYMGPNLIGTTRLVMLSAVLGFAVTSAVGAFADRNEKYTALGLSAYAMYTIGFFIFVCGLLVWLRSRNLGPWPTRFAAVGIVTFLCIAPWVVYSITLAARVGEATPLALACLSPFYTIPLVGAVYFESGVYNDFVHAETARITIFAGAGAALFYALVGISLLASASARARAFVRATLEREAAEDLHFGQR